MDKLESIYLNNSNIPKRYLNDIALQPSRSDLEVFSELNAIKVGIMDFVKDGKNLLIYSGNVGNGKTSWATKILKSYIKNAAQYSYKNNCPGLFINVSTFLNEKKLAISDPDMKKKVEDLERKILSARLVVFDDLCVSGLSEYDRNNLYYWIDHRTNNMLSSIYTTNLNLPLLEKSLDSRVFSRVANYSIIKEIKDGDHRGL